MRLLASVHDPAELMGACTALRFSFVNVSGTRGRDKGEFTNLQGISASSNGRIVVADSNNQCIQVTVGH